MILVDSSVWIDLLRRRPSLEADQLEKLLNDDDDLIVLGDLVLVEVLQGFDEPRQARLIERRLSRLPQISVSDPSLAIKAADFYRTLRSLGITVRKTIDTLIATRCIVDGLALLHRDRDFQPFVDHLGLVDAMAL